MENSSSCISSSIRVITLRIDIEGQNLFLEWKWSLNWLFFIYIYIYAEVTTSAVSGYLLQKGSQRKSTNSADFNNALRDYSSPLWLN